MPHCSGGLTIDYGDHHDRGDDATKYIHNHDNDFSGSLPPLRVELALDSDQRALPSPHHLPPQQAVQVQHIGDFGNVNDGDGYHLKAKGKKHFLSVRWVFTLPFLGGNTLPAKYSLKVLKKSENL